MKLQVHLHQRLLHVLDVGSRVFHESLALPQRGAQSCDLGVRAEAATQQSVGMELTQSCGISLT